MDRHFSMTDIAVYRVPLPAALPDFFEIQVEFSSSLAKLQKELVFIASLGSAFPTGPKP